MKIYTYYLGNGIFPLDWEVCFSTVEEYKENYLRSTPLPKNTMIL